MTLPLAACGEGETTTVTEKVMAEEPTGDEALAEEPTQEDLMMADSMAEEPANETADEAAEQSTANEARRPAGSPYRPLPGDPNVERYERERDARGEGREAPAKGSGPPPEIQ